MQFIDLDITRHKIILWILAFLITIASAVYQRLTGLTYPYRANITLNEEAYSFRLHRTETVGNDLRISLNAPDTTVEGYVLYRRYKSTDEWQHVPLIRENDHLILRLPSQPPAGKIAYYVFVQQRDQIVSLSGDTPVIARYKGAVPDLILLPHVLLMFLAMLFSNGTALEALDRRGNSYKYMVWTIALFFGGGFIFGPIVQKFAFGEFWTGIPFGYDLTDNKTLVAMSGWLVALGMNWRGRDRRAWIFFAAVLMLVIYLIPHSLLGWELDYTENN